MLSDGVTRFENNLSSARSDKVVPHLDLTTAGDLFAVSTSSKNKHSIEMKQLWGGKE